MTDRLNIEEVLQKDGVYISTTSGVSMYPMLRDRRDTIVVTPSTERLKKYDVALYKRGDSYVLHRVLKILEDSYVIRGDNCIMKEYVANDANLLGKLSAFYRNDKEINMQGAGYKIYSRLIVACHPFVCLKLKILARIRRKRRSNNG